jgi:hypothetical protein
MKNQKHNIAVLAVIDYYLREQYYMWKLNALNAERW